MLILDLKLTLNWFHWFSFSIS